MAIDTQIVFTSQEPTTVPPNRGGTSPIGTVSPNTGSSANTNSTYGQGAFASGITEQTSATSYEVQNTDYQGVILFNTASAITVTLNSAVQSNFSSTILNLGTGAITLMPTGGATVNGAASVTLGSGQGCQVFFANRAWLAYAGTTIVQVVPHTQAPVAHKWLASYDASTGIFTITRPDYSDLTGTPQLPNTAAVVAGKFLTGYNAATGNYSSSSPAGVSGTIILAAITGGGTQGSITVTDGIITAFTNPT